MIIDILTLFPEMFNGVLESSIIKRAIDTKHVTVNVHDYREFSLDKNKKVDDYSYGGGAGMVIRLQPIVDCLQSIKGFENAKKIVTTPKGVKYKQSKAKSLSKEKHIVLICGHYEGIDERILNYIDEEISIGDYILTGGEIAALAIIDSVVRLIPGTLGNEQSNVEESFEELLEYPQYTRPEIYDDIKVPDVLLSGNHENIRKYRRFEALKATYERRPDLLVDLELGKEDQRMLEKIKNKEDLNKKTIEDNKTI